MTARWWRASVAEPLAIAQRRETTYAWDDTAPGRTKMTLRNRGEPSGFAAVTASVMMLAMRRANEADLRRLKALLEG
jgi:hypothetical protein